MEIREMNIDAIEERMAAIKEELPAVETEERIAELEEETRALKERKEELRRLAQEAKEERAQVLKDNKVVEELKVEERKMENIITRNSKEYIDAYAEYIKSGDDAECRALLTENVSGGVAVPELVEEIVKTAWEKEGIMSRVKKAYLKGNVKIGFEREAGAAVVHTEGAAAPSEETLTLGIATLVPASIKKWITISDEAMDLRGSAFLQYVYDEVAYQIAKKAADEIVAKIEAAGTTSSATVPGVPKITAATIAISTITKALAQLSDEADNPVVIMNKQSYADFRDVQYANKYPVDIFEGLEVVFNNSITAFSAATTGDTYAIVGDLGHGAMANFPNGDEITFKFDDVSLAEADLVKIVGREYVGLGLVADKAFCKIVK